VNLRVWICLLVAGCILGLGWYAVTVVKFVDSGYQHSETFNYILNETRSRDNGVTPTSAAPLEAIVPQEESQPSLDLKQKPRIFWMPILSQTNAAAYRILEFASLLKSHITERTFVEPTLRLMPLNETAFETFIAKSDQHAQEAHVLRSANRTLFARGHRLEPIGRYFRHDMLRQWLSPISFESVSDLPSGVIEAELLIFCDTANLKYEEYPQLFPISESTTLHFIRRRCYQDEFAASCSFPNVSASSPFIAVAYFWGSFQCANPALKPKHRPKNGKRPVVTLLQDMPSFWKARRGLLRWRPYLYKKAKSFMKNTIKGPYVAVHWRRGDKLVDNFYKRITPHRLAVLVNETLLNRSPSGTAIFLATNSGSPRDLQELQSLLGLPIVRRPPSHDWTLAGEDSIIDQMLCVEADFFLGAPESWHVTSAFTRWIMDERKIVGKSDDSAAYQS